MLWALPKPKIVCGYTVQRKMYDQKLVDAVRSSDVERNWYLSEAAASGDTKLLNFVLDNGANVNSYCRNGWTALHMAAEAANANMCWTLLRRGADVNLQTADGNGSTPLFLAIRRDLQTVQFLLRSGCDLEHRNTRGDTALHVAISSGREDVIAELIASGCDVNAKNSQGMTPLSQSLDSRRLDVCRTLLRSGANPNEVDSKVCRSISQRLQELLPTEKARHVHERVPGPEGVERGRSFWLVDHQDSSERSGTRDRRAADPRRGHRDDRGSHQQFWDWGRLQQPGNPGHGHGDHSRLHQHGDHVDSFLRQQRHHQQRHNNSNAFPCLCNVFVETNRSDAACPLCSLGNQFRSAAAFGNGSSANSPASRRTSEDGKENSVNPLVPDERALQGLPSPANRRVMGSLNALSNIAGGNPGMSKEKCVTPLPGNSLGGNTEAARAKGASPLHYVGSPDAFSKNVGGDTEVAKAKGVTPLHHAARLGLKPVTEDLLQAGACVNARTVSGDTPLHFVALFSSIHSGNTGLLRLLLKAGAYLGAVNSSGDTPLHLAALVGDPLTTSILISAGADVRATNAKGEVPLHKVCLSVVTPEANRVRTARLLLTAKADPDAKDGAGLTPLHVLLQVPERQKNLDVLRELLSQGADPNLQTRTGQHPLLMAMYAAKRTEYAKILVQRGADPNLLFPGGTKPLHLAAEFGSVTLFEELVSKGGDPTARDSAGFTPLRWAVAAGREDMVRACIRSGASTWQRMLPMPELRSCGSLRDILGRFQNSMREAEHSSKITSPFCLAFTASDVATMRLLLVSGSVLLRELHWLSKVCEMVPEEDVLRQEQRDAIALVTDASQSPPTLQSLCRWQISHQISCRPGRVQRVQFLPFPAMLKDMVLFADLTVDP